MTGRMGGKKNRRIISRLVFFVLATILIAWSFQNIRNSWIIPRDSGIAAQKEIDSLFRSAGIEGHASVVFYDERVRFFSDSLSLEDAQAFVPILRDIEWLKLVDFRKTTLSEADITVLQSDLRPIVVVGP